MGQTRAAWETRIRGYLGDLGVLQRVPAERIPLALETALAVLASDQPYLTSLPLTGDGLTFNLSLTGWVDRWSQVVHVEYPTGERIPSYLEARRWRVLPGTSTFRLLEDTPGVGESVTVTFTTRWPSPNDTAATDKVPVPWFEAVCALAASEAAKAQAVEYARRQSVSIVGSLQSLDSGPLFEAASQLRRLYDKVVLGVAASGEPGTPSSSPIALAVEDQETFPRALFHRRSSWTP